MSSYGLAELSKVTGVELVQLLKKAGLTDAEAETIARESQKELDLNMVSDLRKQFEEYQKICDYTPDPLVLACQKVYNEMSPGYHCDMLTGKTESGFHTDIMSRNFRIYDSYLSQSDEKMFGWSVSPYHPMFRFVFGDEAVAFSADRIGVCGYTYDPIFFSHEDHDSSVASIYSVQMSEELRTGHMYEADEMILEEMSELARTSYEFALVINSVRIAKTVYLRNLQAGVNVPSNVVCAEDILLLMFEPEMKRLRFEDSMIAEALRSGCSDVFLRDNESQLPFWFPSTLRSVKWETMDLIGKRYERVKEIRIHIAYQPSSTIGSFIDFPTVSDGIKNGLREAEFSLSQYPNQDERNEVLPYVQSTDMGFYRRAQPVFVVREVEDVKHLETGVLLREDLSDVKFAISFKEIPGCIFVTLGSPGITIVICFFNKVDLVADTGDIALNRFADNESSKKNLLRHIIGRFSLWLFNLSSFSQIMIFLGLSFKPEKVFDLSSYMPIKDQISLDDLETSILGEGKTPKDISPEMSKTSFDIKVILKKTKEEALLRPLNQWQRKYEEVQRDELQKVWSKRDSPFIFFCAYRNVRLFQVALRIMSGVVVRYDPEDIHIVDDFYLEKSFKFDDLTSALFQLIERPVIRHNIKHSAPMNKLCVDKLDNGVTKRALAIVSEIVKVESGLNIKDMLFRAKLIEALLSSPKDKR